MSFPPRWVLATGDFVTSGGMDAANHALASFLLRSGREVELVAHRVAPDLAGLPGAHVHLVPRPFGSHVLGAPLLSSAARRVSAARAKGPVIALANGGNFSGAATWLHYVHAACDPSPMGLPPRRALQRLTSRRARRDERAVTSAAGVVIANSQLTAGHAVELLGAPAEKVHVVYYGVDPVRFRPPGAEERSQARERLGIAGETPTLVFVGALGDRRKGFDTLFEALRRLSRGGGWDATLLVLGEGQELKRWRQRAADEGMGAQVRFLGFQPDVRPSLFAADAVVSPTRYEAYGLAVQEALCVGLPALVTRSAGVAERISWPLRSLLIDDPNDAAGLADRLSAWRSTISAHRAAALRLSAHLRAWTWDDMAARLVDIVERPS